jgi:hypothetical protein
MVLKSRTVKRISFALYSVHNYSITVAFASVIAMVLEACSRKHVDRKRPRAFDTSAHVTLTIPLLTLDRCVYSNAGVEYQLLCQMHQVWILKLFDELHVPVAIY